MNPKNAFLIVILILFLLFTPVFKVAFSLIGGLFSFMGGMFSGIVSLLTWPFTFMASGFFSWNPGWILVIIVILVLYARKSNTSKAN